MSGPYGTNEGDIWSGEDSEVGQLVKQEGKILIHEMMVIDGTLDEGIYVVEENNPDPEMQALLARARRGTELLVAEQAKRN